MGRIKFGVYKAPNTSGKEQQSCARLISKGTMRMEDICEYLSDSCSLTSADVKGAIEALTTSYRTELIERLLCGTGGIRALLPCPSRRYRKRMRRAKPSSLPGRTE